MTQRVLSAKHAGSIAETAVLASYPSLEHVPDGDDPHVDAHTTTPLEVPSLDDTSVPAGTPVEIKTCAVRNTAGDCRGRFYLREDQHDHLTNREAIYLFAVCTPTPNRGVIAVKTATPQSIQGLVPSWRSAGPDRATYSQLSWGRLFDDHEVARHSGGGR